MRELTSIQAMLTIRLNYFQPFTGKVLDLNKFQLQILEFRHKIGRYFILFLDMNQ